jgi:hypothetical protein
LAAIAFGLTRLQILRRLPSPPALLFTMIF